MDAGRSQSDPILSVVIPCHRRVDLLRRCLASVSRFAPRQTEILVVDDGSPQGAASGVAQEFGVRSIRTDSPTGFCAAVNRGIAAASAPIVELLNDDTEVEAGWAHVALRQFDDTAVVAVAPLVLSIGSEADPIIDSAGDGYHLGGFAQKLGRGCRLAQFPLVPKEVFGASASSAFYRRDWLQRIGGFPESFGSYFEDVDVSFRLRQLGGRIIFEPNSRVWHHAHASYGTDCRKLSEQQSRNEERVFWRNVPRAEIAHAFPLHLAVLLTKALRRWREGKLIPFLMGRLRAFVELPELLRQRSECVQNKESVSYFLDRNWWPKSL